MPATGCPPRTNRELLGFYLQPFNIGHVHHPPLQGGESIALDLELLGLVGLSVPGMGIDDMDLDRLVTITDLEIQHDHGTDHHEQ